MTFFVQKRLALGRIRFGVSPETASIIDTDTSLSTGSNGEFVRRFSEGYFFGDEPRFDRAAQLERSASIATVPFWTALKPDGTPMSWAALALLPIGFIVLLLGLAVVSAKGAAGWVEIIFGLAMMAVPIVVTAQRRRAIREEEARRRAEIDAADARNRDMLGSYMTALETLERERTPKSIAAVERERGALDLPYETWAPVARRTIMHIGFDELAKGVRPGAEIGTLLDRASVAAGLSREEATGIKSDLYQTVLWHFIADRRLGPEQERVLAQMREDFALDDSVDGDAAEQFRRIREQAGKPLPRHGCNSQLGFQEHCVYETSGDDLQVHITNKRLLAEGSESADVSLPKVFDIEVNADDATVQVKSTDRKKPLVLRVADPIYTAAMVDTVSKVDTRPKHWQ